MKFNCGPDWLEKHEAKKDWHLHFAWLPVRVGPRDCRWLEWLMRKGKHHSARRWTWEYRAR